MANQTFRTSGQTYERMRIDQILNEEPQPWSGGSSEESILGSLDLASSADVLLEAMSEPVGEALKRTEDDKVGVDVVESIETNENLPAPGAESAEGATTNDNGPKRAKQLLQDVLEKPPSCDYMDNCQTGQFELGQTRKVVSDYFGRNKRETKQIPRWITYCRKHYQRCSYNNDSYKFLKLELIRTQFEIIDAWRPGKRYKITLSKKNLERLSAYYKECATAPRSMRQRILAPRPKTPDEKTTTNEKGKAKDKDKEPEDPETPMNVLLDLQRFLGDDKSKQDAEAFVNFLEQLMNEEVVSHLPHVEFLPHMEPKTSPALKRTRSGRVGKKRAARKSKKRT